MEWSEAEKKRRRFFHEEAKREKPLHGNHSKVSKFSILFSPGKSSGETFEVPNCVVKSKRTELFSSVGADKKKKENEIKKKKNFPF